MAKILAALWRGPRPAVRLALSCPILANPALLCLALLCAVFICAGPLTAFAQSNATPGQGAVNATQAEDSGPKALGADSSFLRQDNATATPELSGAGEVSGALPLGNSTALNATSGPTSGVGSGMSSDSLSGSTSGPNAGLEDSDAPVFSWGGYFKGIGALFLILAALWGVLWFLRRRGSLPGMGGLPRDSFSIEAQLALSPKKKLILVRFLNSRLLLGVTDQQITLLKEVEGPDGREESTKSNARSFAAVIADASQKNDAS